MKVPQIVIKVVEHAIDNYNDDLHRYTMQRSRDEQYNPDAVPGDDANIARLKDNIETLQQWSEVNT
jgi:hypothetical protein